MTEFTTISAAADRVLAALIDGLEIEFGRDAGTALARRFMASEEADFLWDARCQERWIGTYAHAEEHDFELDRVRILGFLDRRWFVATVIVDGDGNPHGMLACREFDRASDAQSAFADA